MRLPTGRLTMYRLPATLLLGLAAMSAQAATVTLTGTVRDFRADNVNFEGSVWGGSGMVANVLAGPSPTLTAYGATQISNVDAGAFSNWYTRPSDSLSHDLVLAETSNGSGIYAYSSNSFFPIDDLLYGNEGNAHNYHFTYTLATTFGYTRAPARCSPSPATTTSGSTSTTCSASTWAACTARNRRPSTWTRCSMPRAAARPATTG